MEMPCYVNSMITILEGTKLLETQTDTDVNMNVFYKDADFKVFPTTYLAMKYSDDEEKPGLIYRL